MITRDSGIVREDLANTTVWNGTVQSVPTERAERYVCTPHQTNLCKTSGLFRSCIFVIVFSSNHVQTYQFKGALCSEVDEFSLTCPR